MRNLHLFILFTVLLVLTGCGDGKSVRQLPHLGDTPYQQDSVLVAYDLLTYHPEMTITDVAREVGFTAPNLREQFKRCYRITPAEYRAGLVSLNDNKEE